MIRVRFHGRGGHGVKTAGRILGTASFLAGYQVQDSPVYGAERRGAAVAAFARIDRQPIRERGVIMYPDYIIVGDETLLEDSTAGVLRGQESASALFLNGEPTTAWIENYDIRPQLVARDVTQPTLETIGKASALSAGLAAAACRLIGIVSESQLLDAVQEELQHLRVDEQTIDRNRTVASRIFSSLEPVALNRTEPSYQAELHQITCDDPIRSTPSILATGNSDERNTGAWRVERPEIDYDICTRCGICFVRCPDGAIVVDEEGYPVIDYDHCKGCMICWDQCPVEGAVTKRKEVRSW